MCVYALTYPNGTLPSTWPMIWIGTMKNESISIMILEYKHPYSLKELHFEIFTGLLVLPLQDYRLIRWLSPQSQQREAWAAPKEPLPVFYPLSDYNQIPVFAEHLQCWQEGSLAYSGGGNKSKYYWD